MTKNIQDVRNVFLNIGISFWQTAVLLILIIVFSIAIIYFWNKRKNFSKVIILSLALSLILGIYILLITKFYPNAGYDISVDGEIVQWTLQQEMLNLLYFTVNIYLGLVFFIVPFFIFFTIVSLIISFKRNKQLSYFFKIFLGLIIPILVAMIMAIVLIPLLKNIELIPEELVNDYNYDSLLVILSNYFLQAGEFMVTSIPILVIVVVSIIVGFAVKSITKSKHEKSETQEIDLFDADAKASPAENFFNIGKQTTLNYLKIINYMLPFVILTRFAAIFVLPEQLVDLLFFFGVFILGLLILVIMWVFVNYFLTPNKKNYFKNYFNYIVMTFTKGSTINYLTDTIEIAEKSGVDKDIAEFGSTVGLNIGPAICSGYYLMLLGLLGLNTISEITIINVIVLFVLILIINFTTTGVKGGDEVARNILVTTLSTFGINPSFYYGTIFAIESILEPIRQIGNGTSYYASNIINQRLINGRNK